jgi:hypothetical protein
MSVRITVIRSATMQCFEAEEADLQMLLYYS